MNILSYKPFAHTESMQDIKLQADNEYEKIMSQFSPLSPLYSLTRVVTITGIHYYHDKKMKTEIISKIFHTPVYCNLAISVI